MSNKTSRRAAYHAANKEKDNAASRAYWIKYPKKRLLLAAKRRANKKGLLFDLTEGDIHIPDTCPILNIWLSHGTGKSTDNSPSLDRVIPEKGYVKGNVIVISWRANRIKSDATATELRTLANFYEALIK